MSFEDIGKRYVTDQIEALESVNPGWAPMFYMTTTFEGDLAAAERLRDRFDMPRPAEVKRRISIAKTEYAERVAVAQAERDHHEYLMKTDWLYWAAWKLGFRRQHNLGEPRE